MGKLLDKLFKQKKTKKKERLEAPNGEEKHVLDYVHKSRKKKKKAEKVITKTRKKKRGLGKNYRTTPLRQQLKRRKGVHGL